MAKETTLFPEFVEKYFGKVIGKITEKYNGEKKKQELLYKTMLAEEYSADLSWGATELNNVIVAADVVAMDASIPLKKRGSLATASGKLSKIALKYRKGEKDISDLNVAAARGTDEATIAAKVLNDVPRVVDGADARVEMMFEQALSTGSMLVEDADNDGVGVRVDFYKEANQFKARLAPWANSTLASPQEDIQQLFDKAAEDGNNIAIVMISKKYFHLFRKSKQGKELAASYQGRIFTDTTILPVPGKELFLNALADEYGAEFRIVDSTFKVQNHDGTEKTIRPWEEANVVGIPTEQVGRLVYGTLAEETNPVASVSYQKSGSWLLISKYSNNDPLEEYTAGQALVIPVLDGADSIYLLIADENAGNALSVADSSKSLSFAKTKETKTVDVTYLGEESNLAVSASEAFVSAALKNGVLSITCAANSASGAGARTATVTVTDGLNSVDIAVSQAANS